MCTYKKAECFKRNENNLFCDWLQHNKHSRQILGVHVTTTDVTQCTNLSLVYELDRQRPAETYIVNKQHLVKGLLLHSVHIILNMSAKNLLVDQHSFATSNSRIMRHISGIEWSHSI